MPLKLSDCTGFFNKEKLRKLGVAAGLVLILIIFVSTLLPKPDPSPAAERLTAEETERNLEKRLEALLAEINGVTSPKVMLTLDTTEQHVYATDSKTGSSSDEAKSSDDSEETVVLIGSGSSEAALEENTVMPKVRGVAVVCGGAENPIIREKVVNTVAGVLDIGTGRIYVTN